MRISTLTNTELEQHLTEIADELARRHNTGTRGDNEYLNAMNVDGLKMHATDIRRELNIRDNEKRRTSSTFGK